MKRTILTSLIIAMITVFSANAQKSMDKFMVQVDGLGCPFCAYGLEKKFKEFKGIKNVKIDIETGDFSFNYPAAKALTMVDVIQQVEKAGYTPVTSRIERADGKVEESETAASSINSEGAEEVTKNVVVAGKCGMCEARIVNTAKSIAGVVGVSWDQDTKMMAVNYDSNTTSLGAIEIAIAKAGHDTENQKTDDATYENLPACCHYDRLKN